MQLVPNYLIHLLRHNLFSTSKHGDGTLLLTNFANSLAVGQVICDDLSELWKMPAIPLPAAHDVVVQLFIQVIQKS